MNRDTTVRMGSKALDRLGWKASMATKCVVQIAVPVATAVITSQPKRVTPSLARARRNSRIAIQQPATHTTAGQKHEPQIVLDEDAIQYAQHFSPSLYNSLKGAPLNV